MRKRILDAATKLFVTQGYAATTMQQIVKEAGTSIGNCYFYFPDKAALMLALIEAVSTEIGQAIDQAMAQVPPGPSRLAVAVYTGIIVAHERRGLLRLLLIEAQYPALRSVAIGHFTTRVERFFTESPDLAQGNDPVLIAHAWTGANFYIQEAMDADTFQDDPAKIGKFLARWNLQALGLAAEDVDQALTAIDTLDKHTQKGSQQ